jgi:serine/threonine-protein kinase
MIAIKSFLPRLISLRVVLVALALVLMIPGIRPSVMQSLDEALYQFVNAQQAKQSQLAHAGTNASSGAWLIYEGSESGLFPAQWISLLRAGVLACSAVFLVTLLPMFGWVSGLFATVFLAFLLLAGQLGWQLTQQQWLPLGDPLQYLLLGYVVMLFWLVPQRRIEALESECHSASLKLAAIYLADARFDDALAQLDNCYCCDESLSLRYNVALEQERKRQYRAAIHTYQSITALKRSFKDASKRTKNLLALEDVEHAPTSNLSQTQTLILPRNEGLQPVLGRYEIERELGRGAMGVVYLGHDPKISRRVAIKTLSYGQYDSSQLAEIKTRFFREAEAAGRLDHPGIVTVYDVGEERDLAYIAMDYVEGRALNQFSRPGQLLAVDTVYQIIADVAEALDYAHRQHIVHRDIKPGNIMFNMKAAQIKVTDFGIARLTDDSRTKTGDVLGSPLYMAPEQLKGKKVNGAADIYSLGVTFYQLLCGYAPFQADSLANLTYQILNTKHKNIRELRAGLPSSATRIINKALQKDPAKRFASGIEMASALRKSMARDFGKAA